jgi:hypothetical protein
VTHARITIIKNRGIFNPYSFFDMLRLEKWIAGSSNKE